MNENFSIIVNYGQPIGALIGIFGVCIYIYVQKTKSDNFYKNISLALILIATALNIIGLPADYSFINIGSITIWLFITIIAFITTI